MTIQMTAAGLRAAADMLDRLTAIEAETGVRFDGAYNGYAMVSVPDRGGEADSTEALRVVRVPEVQVSPNVVADMAYVLEFEVP